MSDRDDLIAKLTEHRKRFPTIAAAASMDGYPPKDKGKATTRRFTDPTEATDWLLAQAGDGMQVYLLPDWLPHA